MALYRSTAMAVRVKMDALTLTFCKGTKLMNIKRKMWPALFGGLEIGSLKNNVTRMVRWFH